MLNKQNNTGKSAFKRNESVPRREQQSDTAQYNNDGIKAAAKEMQRKDGYTFRKVGVGKKPWRVILYHFLYTHSYM